MLYSKTTGGFYDEAIHGDAIPDDAVEITADEHAALLAGQTHGKRIVADANGFPMLADQPAPTAAEIWNRIKAKRDAIKAGGVKVGTKWYHSDTDSRIQFIGLKDQARDILAAGQPDSTRLQKLGQDVKWKTVDGTFIFLTVKHAFDIGSAIGDLDAMAFAAAETHRAAMEASADPAAYDFSAGWPQVYADTLAPAA